MSVRNRKISFLVALALITCMLSAIIVGCNNQETPQSGNTSAQENDGPVQNTPPKNTEGVVISPTDDEDNPGSIEIILPNEDDGEEGSPNDGGNTGNTGNSGNTGNTGNSGNTGNTGNSGNTGNTGSNDPTEGTTASTEATETTSEPTQGNDGTDDPTESTAGADEEETPDLIVDFDDISGGQ